VLFEGSNHWQFEAESAAPATCSSFPFSLQLFEWSLLLPHLFQVALPSRLVLLFVFQPWPYPSSKHIFNSSLIAISFVHEATQKCSSHHEYNKK
jgi:hypothetical protein